MEEEPTQQPPYPPCQSLRLPPVPPLGNRLQPNHFLAHANLIPHGDLQSNLEHSQHQPSAVAVLHLAIIEAEDTPQPRSNRRPMRSAAKSVSTFALTAAALASILGCGNTYRPVVSAINPVGPAAQPTKYAIAVSTPSPTSPVLVTIADFSVDTVPITATLRVAPYYLALNTPANPSSPPHASTTH